MTHLSIGDQAPEFTVLSAAGETSLRSLLGQPLVLYFYPKDDTPTCTEEAKDFSALAGAFREAGVSVVGISPDTVKKHAKFQQKHELTLELLSDPDHAVASSYGVWVQKTMYGRTYMGVERSTFLIGPDATLLQIWRNVRIKGHAEAVLAAVRNL